MILINLKLNVRFLLVKGWLVFRIILFLLDEIIIIGIIWLFGVCICSWVLGLIGM